MIGKGRRTKTRVLQEMENRLNQKLDPETIPPDGKDYMTRLKAVWENSLDVRFDELRTETKCIYLVWLDTLVNTEALRISVYQALLPHLETIQSKDDLEKHIPIGPIIHRRSLSRVHQSIAAGEVVIYLEGAEEAFSIAITEEPGKSIQSSEYEPSIEGPQECFVENLATNMGLLRKRLRTPRLKMATIEVGELSPSQVVVIYIEGVTNPEILQEVHRRIGLIKIDSVVDINVIREMTTDSNVTPFPMQETTDRPDKLIAAILQGRVGIMLSGSPHILLVPVTFIHLLNSTEDAYTYYLFSFPIRLLRHIMFWASVSLPSLYVALLSYHQDLIPTQLLISLEGQHEGIPFPTVVEAFIMQFFFEALREAGQRLPRSVGQSVSIVGGLIIGDAAVNAGIVSPGMVIVVAATGIASFTIPSYPLVVGTRILQFVFLLLAGTLGLYGIVAGGFILVIHMVTLTSYGVPYMSPVAPFIRSGFQDVIFRVPWWAMKSRPSFMAPLDGVRNATPKPSTSPGDRSS